MLSTWCILGAFWNLYCWCWLLILGINNMILHTSMYNVNVNYVCRNFPVSCTHIFMYLHLHLHWYRSISTSTSTALSDLLHSSPMAPGQFLTNLLQIFQIHISMCFLWGKKQTRYFYSGGSTLADCPGTKK